MTLKVRPTSALSVRHYSLSLENFRKFFPVYKARGYAVMYYIFPYAKRVVVELRKDNPEAAPKSKYRWAYRNRFWRKYAPAVVIWIDKNIKNQKWHDRAQDAFFYLLRQAMVWFVRSERSWPHAQIINYPRNPGETKYLFRHVVVPGRAASSISSKSIAISASPTRPIPASAAICRASATPSAATSRRCSPIPGRGPA